MDLCTSTRAGERDDTVRERVLRQADAFVEDQVSHLVTQFVRRVHGGRDQLPA